MSARKTKKDKQRAELAAIGDEFVAGSWDTALVVRLIDEARPYKGLFAGTLAVLVSLFALELAGPWILRHAVDGPVSAALQARHADPSAFDPAPFVRSLFSWTGLFMACTAAVIVLRYFEVAHLARTGQTVVAGLRTKVFEHIQGLDLAWFDKRPTGSLVTRVTTDIENLNEMFTSGLVELGFDLLRIVLLLGVLFLLSWKLALVVLILMPVLIAISLVFRGGARDAHRIVRARLSRLNGYLQEVLSGIRVVQVFRNERKVGTRFSGLLDEYLDANLRTIFLFALFFPCLDFAVNGIQGAALWVGGIDIAGQHLSVGAFFQFWMYLGMLLTPVRELGERYNVLQSAFASAERIFQVLDTRPGLAPPPAAARRCDPQTFRGHVRFEHVSFEYLPGVPVLADVSFEIEPGAIVAVVGATGAGKSTLVNLLLRFYDPTAGRITIDGVDLREWDLDSMRSAFGLVLQEDFLFAGTVAENLVMEREEVSDESLELALEASRAETVIDRLPGGLDAPLAERGATLSTGERQLLAIARALAGRPRLVVLDEATASVDSATEAEIEAAKKSLLAERSALVIAHRLSTVRRADKILVMHRGELREQGTHEELLARGGIYARLHALQFSDDPYVAPPRPAPADRAPSATGA
jgi:ATP-binding cassette, subfamily B, multidrug efflux pump